MYIISSCLLGNNCKYDGGNNENRKVIEFYKKHSCCTVCPETMGGLASPRMPAEIVGDKVIDKAGLDKTRAFEIGALRAWEHVLKQAERRREKIEGAILKSNSPSCGNGKIYDGTFSKRLTQGDGIFVRILKENNIKIISEKEIDLW
ncbi:MAG: DUF523 domain-containing protein [Hornefia sp.]|nr:DUF523 domain-containing protein [Hornefia sp.]